MADDDIPFDRNFDAPANEPERVARNVRRVLAPNAGPFTFTGTCTYIVGDGEVAVIDPGPDDPVHLKAVLDAVRGETVAHILVTHSHIDHSPGAAAMKAATGAKVFAQGPHRASRPVRAGEERVMEAGADWDFAPDTRMADGETLAGQGYALEAVFTPGHAANHHAFALKGTDILFCGAWTAVPPTSRHWCAPSTSVSIRGWRRRRRSPPSRIWRIWWRAARSPPTGRRRSAAASVFLELSARGGGYRRTRRRRFRCAGRWSRGRGCRSARPSACRRARPAPPRARGSPRPRGIP